MALAGRLHPVLVHFPIALLIMAAAAEGVVCVAGDERWRLVARVSLRAGAVAAVAAAVAGWLFAAEPSIDPAPALEWHRWLGTAVAVLASLAAIAGVAATPKHSRATWLYRACLFGAGALIPIAGHLGGVLVWGADFLHL
jgi:uncharacterized membrane protein